MNYCPTHNLSCPYKLSDESPLPCTATQDLCDRFVESQRMVARNPHKYPDPIPNPIKNPITTLQLED